MAPEQIRQMVETFGTNPDVLGLVEYGSARFSDPRIEGDYDLVVVIRQEHPEVESLHFYVGATPVDLNLKSIGDIERMDRGRPRDPFQWPALKVAEAANRVD